MLRYSLGDVRPYVTSSTLSIVPPLIILPSVTKHHIFV